MNKHCTVFCMTLLLGGWPVFGVPPKKPSVAKRVAHAVAHHVATHKTVYSSSLSALLLGWQVLGRKK